MNYSIDGSSSVPAYLQLYNYLRLDIVQGIYALNTRLPSKRVIAAEVGVSIITVEHALELLCDEGYTEARERSGVFVIYKEADFQSTQTSVSTERETVKVFNPQNHRSEFPFSVLAKTMRKVLTEQQEDIMVRSPNCGLEELRREISAYIARSRGIHVETAQIIVGSGAEYLYSLIAQLLGTGRVFALEDPSYEKIRKVYEAYGIQCDMLPMGNGGIQTDALKTSGATVLHVTPFNSYPSGISADISKKQMYIQWAEHRKGYIIEDNYDSELTVSRKNEDPIFALSTGENVIYINTFSQTIAPSMRAGYMILPISLISKFEEKCGFYACTVPVFEQYVLAELLRSGSYERHINRVRRHKRKNLQAAENKH